MLRKILFASSIIAISTGVAMAQPVPYIGAGLGVNVNTSSKGAAGSYRGMPVNVFAGYGGNIDQNFYLAGEFTGTLTNATMNNNGIAKSTYGYGVSVLPGVMLSDHTMAFARAGVVRTHFQKAHNKMITGGELGVGLQTSVTQNVDVRGEYDYVSYKKYSSQGINVNPRSDQFNVSLVYKFQ